MSAERLAGLPGRRQFDDGPDLDASGGSASRNWLGAAEVFWFAPRINFNGGRQACLKQ
jgi:hypothetical protein